MQAYDRSLVWFRRDLRDFDHAALYHALRQSRGVYCAFIFDKAILDALPRADRRVEFILSSIGELAQALRGMGGGLIVLHGHAEREIPQLARRLSVGAVFTNRDYEPAAVQRDARVSAELQREGIAFHGCKDQVIFEKDEVLSLAGKPFSVFTPYKNAWLKKLHAQDDGFYLKAYPIAQHASRLAPPPAELAAAVPTLAQLGFEATNLRQIGIHPGMSGGEQLFEDFHGRLARYHEARDFPAVKGSSFLSAHLRFGTVSIRGLARQAVELMRLPEGGQGAATWLSELIWRDFYFMVLHHHPRVVDRAFKPEYDAVPWESGAEADELFDAWCEGRTGYPLVDAAMRQLKLTGYMHNRLRMVTACFLIKDLGIDWRRGERYFARELTDYELSSNNGGWQWAASSGCDAQPYFRIFNPVTQSQKFDAQGMFIRHYLPQLAALPAKHIHAPWLAPAGVLQQAGIAIGRDYPAPVVQHDEARLRTLARYAVVKKARVDVAGSDEGGDGDEVGSGAAA
ncbi:deoxyribodipyrimidine photo-lyase [Noviherbaspirillum sp. CPCC 100848]|uniref:Deoxyribodipyrimidine photo-lyase n=1 Tax=Noviherbaspirillum album TaxID=3080276 RepID=A0ABU6J6J2_9BURK|nr:deoxyribodipyrimidine photo-lyase [Noviherbaspirillum sp. CPCC 100848]MEC4719258.1 deoxyribodipyrimidine photo-lyase [Noviherbaspirillum sp. CPCC 100848]